MLAKGKIQNLINLSLSFSKIFILLLCLFGSSAAHATSSEVFFKADNINYSRNADVISARGNVNLLFKNYSMQAERIVYDIKNDLLWAEGAVRIIDKDGQVISGETVFLTDSLKQGIITNFIANFAGNATLVGKLLERAGRDHTYLYCSSFTPCKIEKDKKPIWQISSQQTHIDTKKYRMSYKNVFFEVYGVPIFYLPYLYHPSSGAPASSGLLVPEIKKDEFRAPIYWRIKKNMDMTITPRIARKYNIMEAEFRHRIHSGQYNISGSYGSIDFQTIDSNENKHNSNNRYHIFAEGDFKKGKYHYGFNLKSTSDKAYLKNYHDYQADYLESSSYLHKINMEDYYSIKFMRFQSLRSDENIDDKDVFLLPEVRVKKSFDISDLANTRLIFENKTSIYKKSSGKNITRTFLNIILKNNIVTDGGHLLNTSLRNRFDLRNISSQDPARADQTKNADSTFSKHITPEAAFSWRYPVMTEILSKNIMLEPVASVLIGKKKDITKQIRDAAVDSDKYEVNENNLFMPNHYSGIDFYDTGTRGSYGIYSSMQDGKNYFSAFLGQLFNKNDYNQRNHLNYVGSVNVNLAECVDFYYKFRKTKKWQPILTEISASIAQKGAKMRINYVEYEAAGGDEILKYIDCSNIKQVNYKFTYDINDRWQVGHKMRFNLSGSKNRSVLYKGIHMRYKKDCIMLTLKLYDDYTEDKSRGISKRSGKTILLGVKMLNM